MGVITQASESVIGQATNKSTHAATPESNCQPKACDARLMTAETPEIDRKITQKSRALPQPAGTLGGGGAGTSPITGGSSGGGAGWSNIHTMKADRRSAINGEG